MQPENKMYEAMRKEFEGNTLTPKAVEEFMDTQGYIPLAKYLEKHSGDNPNTLYALVMVDYDKKSIIKVEMYAAGKFTDTILPNLEEYGSYWATKSPLG